jgi:hypothetical protein
MGHGSTRFYVQSPTATAASRAASVPASARETRAVDVHKSNLKATFDTMISLHRHKGCSQALSSYE